MHGHTVTINIKRLHSTDSIDGVALAPDAESTSYAATQAESTTDSDDQPPVDEEGNSREYLVNKIVAHRRDDGKNLYKVRWYR